MAKEQDIIDQFDTMLAALSMEAALLDSSGVILAVNQRWQEFSEQNGLAQENHAIGQNYLHICQHSEGNFAASARSASEGIQSVLTGHSTEFTLDYPCHSSSEARWFRLLVSPVITGSGYALVLHQDITEQKRQQLMQKVESDIMKMINSGTPLPQMFEKLIAEMENIVPDALASILLLDKDGRHIRHGAAPRLPERFNQAVDGIQIGPRAGSCGTAMYLRQRVITADILEDSKWQGLRDIALESGLRACWSVPVLGEGEQALAAFAFYHQAPRIPSEEELALIHQAAALLGLAIERKRNQQALDASILRFQGVFNNAAAGILVTDKHTALLEVNPVFCTMLGYSKSLLLERTVLELTEPEFRPQLRHHIDALLTGENERFALELRFMHRHGQPVWFQICVACLRDAQGLPCDLVMVCENIDEQKQTKQRLQDTTRRFRYVAQATVDAIWDWDLLEERVWWSSGFYQLFGYDESQMEDGSCSWTDNIHPDDRNKVLASLHEVIHNDAGVEWSYEYRFRRQDGSYAQVKDKGHVIRDEQGSAIRMVGGMSDITREHLLEEKLRSAQKLESLGQLTGGIAHDFNNILTVIMGNAELALDMSAEQPESQEDIAELLEIILSAGQSGAELTQRLLAFARRQPLAPCVVDVNRLVSDMDPLLRRTLGEHIEVEWIRAAGLWQTLVDPSQLQNALLNLCINAVDAMPDGGRLTIETANTHLDDEYAMAHVETKPGQYVMIVVSDTGQGMPAEVMQKAFDPFFTTKGKGKGTGLGLSMVFGFIKQSQGHVNIYSEPEQGTSIRLYLPKVTGKHPPMPTPRAWQNDALSGSEKVLLVEDDAMVRKFAESVLRRAGYQVYCASHGQQALELAEQLNSLALLVTDVVMPGMSGSELAKKIIAMKPQIKVLYISGYTENAIVHHGRLDPGVHLLNKPFRRAELLRKVRDLLAGQGAD